MASIRTPAMTAVYTSTRQCKSSPRCLVVTLTMSFFLFNWVVYHLLSGHRDTTPSPSSSPSFPLSASLSSSTPRPHSVNHPEDRPWAENDTNPDWQATWFRWRTIDPAQRDIFKPKKVDVVYTWVNGSDPDLRSLRARLQAANPLFHQNGTGDEQAIETTITKRFRDLDELRYNVRSVAAYARDMIRNVHILTTEVAPGRGQVPSWLDPTAAAAHTLKLVPHPTVFANTSHLPSFNSLSIESQIFRIPGLSDIIMYLNDDFFLGRTMIQSDLWTELYGFVFHFEGVLQVPPVIKSLDANPINVGEWSSLQFSNYLLSERFGPRYRAYLAHVPHVLSPSMIQEIESIWPEEMDATSSHRFRGEGGARDIQIAFMMAHYVMEKLRETQIQSYWRYRLDANMDGQLSWAERDRLIRLVRSWNQNQKLGTAKERHSRATMLAGHKNILTKAGVPMSGSTDYRYAGLDGYHFMIDNADTSQTVPLEVKKDDKGNTIQPQTPYYRYDAPQTRTCQLDLNFCLGKDFLNANLSNLDRDQSERILKRLLAQEFHCGDCLLEMLMQHTSTGISAILPVDERSIEFRKVIRDLKRYNYVLGTSDYMFMALQGIESAQQGLNGLLEARDKKVFFCINDDFPDNPELEAGIMSLFGSFMKTRFPIPSPWEYR